MLNNILYLYSRMTAAVSPWVATLQIYPDLSIFIEVTVGHEVGWVAKNSDWELLSRLYAAVNTDVCVCPHHYFSAPFSEKPYKRWHPSKDELTSHADPDFSILFSKKRNYSSLEKWLVSELGWEKHKLSLKHFVGNITRKSSREQTKQNKNQPGWWLDESLENLQ